MCHDDGQHSTRHAHAKPVLNESPPAFHIWVDGDACPAAVKEILFRTAKRTEVPLTVVANQGMHLPRSKFLQLELVPHGADAADDRIVANLRPGDLVITSDIPLAARVVENECTVISTRGELLDDRTVHDRLASRDLMEGFRAAGLETAGPPPLSAKDVQNFANQLDRLMTRKLRPRRPSG